VSVGQRSPAGSVCPSTGTVEEGYDCNGNTQIGEDAPKIAEQAANPGSKAGVNSVAKDGTVVFTSELPLTPGAVQGRILKLNEGGEPVLRTENVYEYRAGQVYLISPADEATPANYAPSIQTRLFGIDESGGDVFFASVDRLLPQDTDTQSSWYDARVNGGYPAPVSQSGCTGEACQGVGPVAPSLSSALVPPAVDENAASSPPMSGSPKPRTAAQVRAERLARALRACKAKRQKRARVACERSARRKFGAAKKAGTTHGKGKG
jgi:hypothetical protein